MEGERRRGQTLIGISLHTYGLSEGAVPLAKAVGAGHLLCGLRAVRGRRANCDVMPLV